MESEVRNDNQITELYSRSFVIPPELIIGAIFDNIEYNESDISKTYYPEHIPKDLTDELTISNVSEIMFNLVSNYNNLKKPILNFMAINFEEVYQSQEFEEMKILIQIY
ncbi:hypothetical protein RhiirA4_464462 [Rhizophagus irregularis]|uniref:Uncharacterized protein n=1 Tax=Rhizophagus irregularis TaxID=588596 RepID=A0A2I1GQ96_9GLOM|nr:hypothetical protein RhiirA4_464462 [Rhizophagus irregularis]